jgi:hypothetical protein
VYAFQGRAYKLFRSRSEVPPRRTRAGRREIFERQREAYHVEGNFAFLAQHIPQYFGTVEVEDVISTEGESIRDGFLLDCCYVTELLNCTENKVTDAVVLEQYPHVSEEP